MRSAIASHGASAENSAPNSLLLVGNFGDGRITAFHPVTGAVLGQLSDEVGDPLEIEGLWGLDFPECSRRLYFAAGPDDEEHGLFGLVHTQHP